MKRVGCVYGYTTGVIGSLGVVGLPAGRCVVTEVSVSSSSGRSCPTGCGTTPKEQRWGENQLCHAKLSGQAAGSDDLDATGERAFGQVDTISRADHVRVASHGGRDEVEVIGVELTRH